MVALSMQRIRRRPCARRDAAPLVWVLHDGKAGMASQVARPCRGDRVSVYRKALAIRAPWACAAAAALARAARARSARAALRLTPPWPDLVIGCGRNTALPALAISRASGGRTFAAQIQDPRVGRDEFDLMVVPEHDRLRGQRVS